MNAIEVGRAGHVMVFLVVIAAGTSATTLVEDGLFNVNNTVSVENCEVIDVRATEAEIVPDVESAVCML